MKKALIILCLILPMFLCSCSDKPAPKFRNGDMVVHTVSEKDGQVINNSYVFNRQSWCWKVQVRMKGVETKDETEKIEKSRLKTSFVKFGKLIENIPETFNEFELEKR